MKGIEGLSALYKDSLALLTDFYQLTMAYAYWKNGLADRESVFHLFYRRKPFGGGFAIAAGLETALSFLQNFHYSAADLSYLEQQRTPKGAAVFEPAFLDYLSQLRLRCDVDAVPEGTVIFPYEPILRVQGPILQAQLLESPLLNMINFQTLVATKAARISFAAHPDPVIEFGMRRAQGIDGSLSASRAAFIGGCQGTSNVLAGKLFGIPIRGTHAHSWIMAFDDEEEAFMRYCEVLPEHCIFLVDTYQTIAGVKKAIRVGKRLKERGIEMAGVRIDSGDLAHLSIEIRRLLDEAGFPHAQIMASNELDERIIKDLKHQGAKVNVWGVGTNLVTGKEQPALDGVYKLSALRDQEGRWSYKLKISEQIAKVTDPGILQIRRYFNESGNVADMIYNIETALPASAVCVDPLDPTRRESFAMAHGNYQDLLVPMMRAGKNVYDFPSLVSIQEYAAGQLRRFHPSIRRFLYPQPYFVGLEQSLYEFKLNLIQSLKTS